MKKMIKLQTTIQRARLSKKTTMKLDRERNQQKLFFDFFFSQSKTTQSRKRKQRKLFFDFSSFFMKSQFSKKKK